MKNVNSLIVLLTLAACVPPLTPSPPEVVTTPDPGAAAQAGQPPQVITTPDPGTGSGTGAGVTQPTTLTLTYYKLSKTSAPFSGWSTKTVTTTGMCVVYLTQTYCWDDGVKTLSWLDFSGHAYGPFTYSYFALSTVGPCSGGCGMDALLTPTLMTNSVEANINVQGNPTNEVFNLGQPVQVTCAETDTKLDCVDFSINR